MTTPVNSGFFSGLNIKDVFNAYVQTETAKVNARMASTAPEQAAGLNATGRRQNVQAGAGAAVHVPFHLTGKEIGLGLGGLGLLLAGLKVARVI